MVFPEYHFTGMPPVFDKVKAGFSPIAIELIEKYRGTDEKKDSPNVSFR